MQVELINVGLGFISLGAPNNAILRAIAMKPGLEIYTFTFGT